MYWKFRQLTENQCLASKMENSNSYVKGTNKISASGSFATFRKILFLAI